jgi:hypothetical protein
MNANSMPLSSLMLQMLMMSEVAGMVTEKWQQYFYL